MQISKMVYIDEDCEKLHKLLQEELNFTADGIPLPKKERGYNLSFQVRNLIHRLADQHGIKLT